MSPFYPSNSFFLTLVEGICLSLTATSQDRVTAHTGIFDFADGQLRHLARLTPQAEVPFHLLSSSIDE
jgi:hypothetical protein